MGTLWALLIGVDHYFEGLVGGRLLFPSLSGCVRDIEEVEAFLKARVHLTEDHMLKLIIRHGIYPLDSSDQWPTYENIVGKFRQLAIIAQPGDQVYIHYAGHGGRAMTAFPEIKGSSGLDEALVPCNIAHEGARYLRDVELHYLIRMLLEKGLTVTVVLDCCHSGSGTRGFGGAVMRGATSVDMTPSVNNSLVAPITDLISAWQTAAGVTRAVNSASGWVQEVQGYTLLAACRANESAYEYPFEGWDYSGAFTYWLVDTLRQYGPQISLQFAFERVVAKVHGQFERQTPVLEGERGRAVFGSTPVESADGVLVLQVINDNSRVKLNCGEVHGVAVGTQFALYEHHLTEFGKLGRRLAVLEVTKADEVESWADVIELEAHSVIEIGSKAVPLQLLDVRLLRHVAVAINEPALRQRMEQAIAREGRGFVAITEQGGSADFQVTVHDAEGTIELWDSAGAIIPNLHPTISATDPTAATRTTHRLVHLAKFRAVQELTGPVTAQPKLGIELAGSDADGGKILAVQPGETVTLNINNLQQPNPNDPNDERLILNVTVLNLASDWSITQVFPARAGAFEIVQPGATLTLNLQAYLPHGYQESRDILKVFATRATTQFRWLELPALDAPVLPSATVRGAFADPLERLLALIGGEHAPSRALRLPAGDTDPEWTVSQVELRVKAY